MAVGAALCGYIIGVSLALYYSASAMPGISAYGVHVTGLGMIVYVLMVGALLYCVGVRHVQEEGKKT